MEQQRDELGAIIGNSLKKNYGMRLNIKTGKNDVARLPPLKSRDAEYCACGIAWYLVREGAFMFGKKYRRPRAISMTNGELALSSAVLIAIGAVSAIFDRRRQLVEDVAVPR